MNREKIEKLKAEGRQFNEKSFQQLLMIVEKSGVIDINLSGNDFEIDERLLEVINNIELQDDQYIPGVLVSQIKSLMETYTEKLEKDTDTMRNVKNYLGRANAELQTEILDFIKNNSGINKKKLRVITEFLENFEEWNCLSN